MGKFLHRLLHIIHSVYYWILFVFVKNNKRFQLDLRRWSEWKSCPYKTIYMQFVFMMSEYQEFRNICYLRMGKVHYLLQWLSPPLDSLNIDVKDIGGGFLVQHGFSTTVGAVKIGENFKLFQQVTIGYNGDKKPVIGDNVEICCGAKVLGGIHIGNNAVIGAQALVIHDVPENAVVGAPLPKIIYYKTKNEESSS